MTWNLFKAQQQRGAQLPPEDAVAGREAQDHEAASRAQPQPGRSPASPIEHGGGDNTPTLGEPAVDWDELIQPEAQTETDDLNEDERGFDAERVPGAPE